MIELPLAYSFAAGMAATVNPCGFVMLPTLVSYYLGTKDAGYAASSITQRTASALGLGLAATSGFVALFAVVGVTVSAGGHALVAAFPWFGLGIGALLVLMGIWLVLSGRSLGVGLLHRIQPPTQRSPFGLFLFGVAYGTASLSCTLPIFLVVVGGALATSGPAAGVLQFIGYALGMGAVLIAVSVATALSQGAIVRGFRALVPAVERLGAVLLVGAGVYLVIYWWPQVAQPLG
jgi:cytochrome c-type biogenesis protein